MSSTHMSLARRSAYAIASWVGVLFGSLIVLPVGQFVFMAAFGIAFSGLGGKPVIAPERTLTVVRLLAWAFAVFATSVFLVASGLTVYGAHRLLKRTDNVSVPAVAFATIVGVYTGIILVVLLWARAGVDVAVLVFALTVVGALVGTLPTGGAPHTTAWTLACVALVAVSPIALEFAWHAAQPSVPQESTLMEPLEPAPPAREIVRTPDVILTLVAVVPGGDVYFDDAGGSLRVRTRDGGVGVVYSTDEKVRFGPGLVTADATIYAPTTGRLHAFDSEGKSRWTYNVAQRVRPRVLALGADGTVYVAISGGKDSAPSLRAVTKDGREKWAVDTPATGASAGSDGAVFVTSDRGMSAYSPHGTLLWHVDGKFDAQPAIGADGTVYVAAPRTLTAISPQGTTKWSADITPMRSHHAHTPCVSRDGTLYVLNSTLWALDSAGVVKWRWTPAGAPPTRGMVQAHDGTIILGAVTGEVYGLTADGKLRWIHNGPPLQGMRLDGEMLYLALEQQIVALDLRR